MENDRPKSLQADFVSDETANCSVSGVGITTHPATLTFTTLCNAVGPPQVVGSTTQQSLPCQSLSVVQDASSASVAELINSIPLSASLSGPQMPWSNIGGQNAIITLHTLPFMEGTQGITITDAGVNLDPNLVQTLLSQAVGIKTEELGTSAAGGAAMTSNQLTDVPPTPTFTLLREVVPSVSQPAAGVAVISEALPTEKAITLESAHLEPAAEITDETLIFSRVCATLDPGLVSGVPAVQDVLMEQLMAEEDVRVGIDEDRHFTLETSLQNLLTIHNRLKEQLNLPTYTKFSAHTVPTPPSTPPPPSPKKSENVGVMCQLLVPFVSSKGRKIKMPSTLQGAVNDHDYLDSDDAEDEIKKYSRRRKNHPRKLLTSSYVCRKVNANSVVVAPNTAAPDTAVTGSSAETEWGDALGGQTVHSETTMSADKQSGENSEDAENIADISHHKDRTILRKTRRNRHETQATHMRRIYEGRVPYKFFCRKCSFKSKRESHFVRHMKHHETPGMELHRCTECDFKTIRLSHLRRHELLHKKLLVTCTVCGYVTDSNQQLLKHMKLKHPHGKDASPPQEEKPFKCDICGQSLSTRAIYNQHLLKHAQESNTVQATAPEGSFHCSDCNKTFLRRVYYDRHRRDVHGPEVRPHLCDICGKAFKRTDALQQHKVVHMSQTARVYTFHCSQCNKGFRSQAHLNEHMTMHSTDRPFLCQYCGSAFKTPSVQKKHILSIHLKPRSYACDLCEKKFNTRSALQRHTRTHELEAQSATAVVTEGSLVELRMVEAEHLQQQNDVGTVVMADGETAAEVLQTQQQTLVPDVMGVGGTMEEALEQGEVLQPQYIQGNETTTALFYLTGSLMEPSG